MSSTPPRQLSDVNQWECEPFVALLGNVVEHNALCAAAVWGRRPFTDVEQLQGAFAEFLDVLPLQGKEGVLRLYPDLAGKLSLSGELTSESQREHEAAGLDRISDVDRNKMADLNARYKAKFGFPFVVCARENKVATILKGLEIRLENNKAQEAVTGVNEVKKICGFRLRDLVAHSAASAKI